MCVCMCVCVCVCVQEITVIKDTHKHLMCRANGSSGVPRAMHQRVVCVMDIGGV